MKSEYAHNTILHIDVPLAHRISFSNTRAYDPPVTGRRERSDDERRLLGDYEFVSSVARK